MTREKKYKSKEKKIKKWKNKKQKREEGLKEAKGYKQK